MIYVLMPKKLIGTLVRQMADIIGRNNMSISNLQHKQFFTKVSQARNSKCTTNQLLLLISVIDHEKFGRLVFKHCMELKFLMSSRDLQ
jgi:hypothetical protein